MKKVLSIFSYVVGAALLLIVAVLTYVKTMLPNVGEAPSIVVAANAAKIDRGHYLAHHVMLCIDCHSTRNWDLFAGPMVPGTEGKGGEVFDQQLGFPGKYISSNLTPFNLQSWTDGEIFRAITAGVTKSGRALFPIMPHPNYGQLDRADIEAVIAYIRTLKPIEYTPEVSTSDFPMNFILHTIPKQAALTTIPQKSDKINYGKYMTTAAGCVDCHTKQEKGKFVGEHFAGGFEFKLLDESVVRSPNLTCDKSSGLGNWTSQQFVNRFKTFSDSNYVSKKVAKGEFQTVMPWTMYAGMDTTDLEAIFAYLQSLPATTNQVEKFTAAR